MEGPGYIGGPMRRLPEYNFPAFFECEDFLRTKGHRDLFNPARRDVNAGFKYKGLTGHEDLAALGFDLSNAMAADLDFIVNKAKWIILLPGWSKSSGALHEKATAEILDIPVYYYNPARSPGLSSIRMLPLDIDDPQYQALWREEVKVQARHGETFTISTGPLEVTTLPSESVAAEAARTVDGRRESYGSPMDDFERAAAMFFHATGKKHDLHPEEVAIFQICVKLSRRVTSPKKRDHMVDIAGYADCYWSVMEEADA